MIAMIVACDEDYLIGQDGTDNGLPWHNSEDLRHYKATTLNHAIVMGRKTYEAIGRPLPKRHTIVLTRGDYDDGRVEVCHDLKALTDDYRERGEDLFICGGASVYEAAMDVCDTILMSRIPGHHKGNAWFPEFKSHGYTLTRSEPYETFVLETYTK